MKNNNPSDYFIPKHIEVLTEAQLYADIHMFLEEADLLNEVDLNKLKKALKTGGAVAVMLLGAQLAQAQDTPTVEKGGFDLVKMLMNKYGKDAIDITDVLSKEFPKEYEKAKKARGSENPKIKLNPEDFDTPSEFNSLRTDTQKAIWKAYVYKGIKDGILIDKRTVEGEPIATIKYDFTSGKESGTLPIAKFKLIRTPDKIMTVADKKEADRIKREEEERKKRLGKAFAEAMKQGLSEFEHEGGRYAVKLKDPNEVVKTPEKGTLEISFISGKSDFVRIEEYA